MGANKKNTVIKKEGNQEKELKISREIKRRNFALWFSLRRIKKWITKIRWHCLE